MGWRRLGHLALDTSAAPWAATHAALPVTEPAGDDAWYVYLSLRDAEGRARIGRTRLALAPAPRLEPLEAAPILDLGPLGAFDDRGVTSSCIVTHGRVRYLYYTGWSLGVSVPFYLAAGVAISENGAPFRRLSPAPLLDRNVVDPFLTASPFVLIEGSRWRMWYVSGTSWTKTATGAQHAYHVRYAESTDGLTWQRDGRVCLDYASPEEHAFARPCVAVDGGTYRMWYAVRGAAYRIGYAESADGLEWRRLDRAGGLGPAAAGWDADMVEYPWVFETNGDRYMLYNGNGFGRTGVGIAVWDRTAADAAQPS
jgi:hypothetical protein